MRTLLAILSLLVFTPDVTKEDVKKLVAAGVSDDVIVDFIRFHGPVSPLSTEDLLDLRAAHVSAKVLAAMIEAVSSPGEEVEPAASSTVPWYYPYGQYYDYYYAPYFWWYLGPGYFHRHHPPYRYPYGYRSPSYPYGYHYPHYPYAYHWGPYPHYPYQSPVNPH